jgi:hypothetical protein
MPGKRHHYVPRLLLRRFVVDSSAKKLLLYRLDKATGRVVKRDPINEAVIGHYYRITMHDGAVLDEADKAFDRIETMAAESIQRLEDRSYIGIADDHLIMMLFAASLQRRTPQAREVIRETTDRAAEIHAEQRLSDKSAYHEAMRGQAMSEQEVEAERQRLLKLFREGKIRAEGTPSHEIAFMLVALEDAVNTMFERLGVTCLRVPINSKRTFILSDHPVSHYDQLAPTPEAGIGFLSSPVAMTWVPLDPKFGLLLTPDHPGSWGNVVADDEDIDMVNLLTYAWARDAIYGCSQQAVTETRHYAKKHPGQLAKFHYRPGRLWVSRGDNDNAGPVRFESRFRDQTVQRTVWVAKDADRAAEPVLYGA